MAIISLTQSSGQTPDISAFKQAATQGNLIYLDGTELVVLGSGTTPKGRKIDWVAPSGDATSSFNRALTDAVGSRLSNVIARELNLTAAPGKPLSARTIEIAISMANEGQRVMEGVNFLTFISFSAVSKGNEFNQACVNSGINPGVLSDSQRQQIDNDMQQKFHNAEQSGNAAITQDQIKQWLVEILQAYS